MPRLVPWRIHVGRYKATQPAAANAMEAHAVIQSRNNREPPRRKPVAS